MAFFLLPSLLSISCTTGNPNPQSPSDYIYKQHIAPTTNQTYPAKKPNQITLYKKGAPYGAYRIIGVAKVAKYNLLGQKRAEATLHKMMKKLAASIGGDALIHITHSPDKIEAKVIQLQNILL
jgi:hypothetical protein